MTTSHADKHDLDKLARWCRDLSLNPPNPPLERGARGDFPVYAVFLVSEADRPAHGIFREFRTKFESWSAGFEHLVIFGQHGLSSTVRGLLSGFGLSLEAVPALVLFSSPLASQAYSLPLAAADEGCRHTLTLIEAALDKGEKELDLASLSHATRLQLDDGTVAELVAILLRH
jgi:hypothetical protein